MAHFSPSVRLRSRSWRRKFCPKSRRG
jgi:hypothetical protein